MDKIKSNTGIIDKWITKYKGPYVLSDKLDGSSGMLIIKDNQIKLYTRGNGSVGTDISSMTQTQSCLRNVVERVCIMMIQKRRKYAQGDTNE
jgi:NAD-dependent DNA ligase